MNGSMALRWLTEFSEVVYRTARFNYNYRPMAAGRCFRTIFDPRLPKVASLNQGNIEVPQKTIHKQICCTAEVVLICM